MQAPDKHRNPREEDQKLKNGCDDIDGFAAGHALNDAEDEADGKVN